PQSLTEGGEVNGEPVGPGDVHQVGGHHDGDAEVHELRRQVEVAFQVGRIDDGQDDVRPPLPFDVTEQQVHGYHLVRAPRGQAVGPGQVDDAELDVAETGGPVLHLDRDARIVADVLAQSSESIEKGGLARVWVPDQGHRQRACRHECGGIG